MGNYIPKADLEHGAYYEGACRNAFIARWNAKTQRFYYWRTKWNHQYIEDITCPEDETYYDVFHAVKKIPTPINEIPLVIE